MDKKGSERKTVFFSLSNLPVKALKQFQQERKTNGVIMISELNPK